MLMIPYSLYCDPGSIIEVAANNEMLDRMPLLVSQFRIVVVELVVKDHSRKPHQWCFIGKFKKVIHQDQRHVIGIGDYETIYIIHKITNSGVFYFEKVLLQYLFLLLKSMKCLHF